MRRTAFVIVLLGMTLISCTTRQVSPTRASRRAIDTIFQSRVIQLQPHMDSVCRMVRDSVYASAVDSILRERQEEMNELVK